MNRISPPIIINRNPHVPIKSQSRPKVKEPFGTILQKELDIQARDIKLSKHATERLHKRGIKLSEQDIKELSLALDTAEEKGAKSSLIVYHDNAFIVSVKNRTVITALDGASTNNNVFTNIDSAVIWNSGAGPQRGSS